MNRINKLFRSKPVGSIIIASCVVIVLILTVSLLYVTFSIFRSEIDVVINTLTSGLSTQIVYNYENFIDGIIKTSNIIQNDCEGFEITAENAAEDFSGELAQIVRFNNNIIKISIYDIYEDEKGRCIISSYENDINRETTDKDKWFFKAINDSTVNVFTLEHLNNEEKDNPPQSENEEVKVRVSKLIKYQNRGEDHPGVLLFEFNFQDFSNLIDSPYLHNEKHLEIIDSAGKNEKHMQMIIIDSAGEIVFPNMKSKEDGANNANKKSKEDEANDKLIKDGAKKAKEIILGSKNEVIGGLNMAMNVSTLRSTGWRICVFNNIQKFKDIERSSLISMFSVSFIVLVTGILLFTAVARTITLPIKKLELAMRKVEKSDYFRMEEVQLTAFKEVEALTGRFNRMMRKIGELMDRVIAEQNAQRKSELKALQNQINPHFLYNTLDSILWLIENNRNEESAEMIVALAMLFRIGISNDSEVVSVRDEVEHVRNYLLIQKIRYADSFSYEFDVDENALDIKTLKLVLQPIVENSIYHGLKNKIDEGRIRISAYTEDDRLILCVSDNGYGMRQETISRLYQSFEDRVVCNNVGLKNIYQRVMIYYGGEAEVIIGSELDKGTTITIKQPLSRIENVERSNKIENADQTGD